MSVSNPQKSVSPAAMDCQGTAAGTISFDAAPELIAPPGSMGGLFCALRFWPGDAGSASRWEGDSPLESRRDCVQGRADLNGV